MFAYESSEDEDFEGLNVQTKQNNEILIMLRKHLLPNLLLNFKRYRLKTAKNVGSHT
jgi:hypothetical protein